MRRPSYLQELTGGQGQLPTWASNQEPQKTSSLDRASSGHAPWSSSGLLAAPSRLFSGLLANKAGPHGSRTESSSLPGLLHPQTPPQLGTVPFCPWLRPNILQSTPHAPPCSSHPSSPSVNLGLALFPKHTQNPALSPPLVPHAMPPPLPLSKQASGLHPGQPSTWLQVSLWKQAVACGPPLPRPLSRPLSRRQRSRDVPRAPHNLLSPNSAPTHLSSCSTPAAQGLLTVPSRPWGIPASRIAPPCHLRVIVTSSMSWLQFHPSVPQHCV